MSTEQYFRGKGCVVTGAASGIGYAISEALLNVGATVFMADRDAKTLASSVEQLSAHAGKVHSATVDVTKQEQVHQLIQDAAARHGRLDVLFNNAGVAGRHVPLADTTLDEWRILMEINLWGVIYGIYAAVPIMRCQGEGHIVNTASILGLIPGVYEGIYSTIKHAVVGLSECLRYELADDRIAVSVVCPSTVASRIWGMSPTGEYREPSKETIPDDVISAAEAAETILAEVANKQAIILVGKNARWLRDEYYARSESFENFLLENSRKGRRSYEASRHDSSE